MNIIAQRHKIIPLLGVHNHRFITALKQMAAQAMKAIEAHRPGRLEPTHPSHKVRLRRFNQQVIMVTHKHERMQPPPRPLARLFQRSYEGGAILVGLHDWFAAIATIKHMINRTGELDSTLASHCSKLLRRPDRRPFKNSENHRLTPSVPPRLTTSVHHAMTTNNNGKVKELEIPVYSILKYY